jgi:hypothetical protein
MPTISSREDKLMLNAAKFAGDEDKLNAAAGALWGNLAAIIVPSAAASGGLIGVSVSTGLQKSLLTLRGQRLAPTPGGTEL